jgi:putative ABC transport system permease protein
VKNVTIKGLLAHKLRLALTSVAIVLGVTFIAGTFVLTDTLHNTFSSLFGNIYQKIDFQVRGVAQFSGNSADAVRNPMPESVLSTVRHVPGVAVAFGQVQGYAQFVSHKGTAIPNNTAPTYGIAFDPDHQISELRLIEGKPPTSSHDVVMDAGTAKAYHFEVGQSVRILSAGPPKTYTITGIAQFGNAPNLAGATLAAFTLPTAQAVVGAVGELDYINVVAKPGAAKAVVQRDIARALPTSTEVVSGQTVVQEDTSQVDQALSFFSTALLVFAFISLFVGAFTIFNTFSITISQRTRELALLRVVGASRRQVFRSVLAEAGIVGAVSSVIGIGLGVLAAFGLKELLSAFGIDLPSGPLVFETRTVLVSLAVGIGVTVIASVGPARRAVRIPPVAALSQGQAEPEVMSRRQLIRGAAVSLIGGVVLAIGLIGPNVLLVAVAALLVRFGVAMLAPAVARPLSAAVGRPLAGLFGEAGKLGRLNSMRSPRRTAQTASALIIGIALVSAMAVFGASVSKSATATVDDAIRADLLVTTSSGNLSDSVPAVAAAVSGVTTSATIYQAQFEFRGSLQTLTSAPAEHLSDTVTLHMKAGSTGALAGGEMLVDSTTARSDHLLVGNLARVKFAATGPTTVRVGGIYQPNALIGSYLVSNDYFRTHFTNEQPVAVLLRTNGASGVDDHVKAALSGYSNAKVQTRAQFEQAETSSVNQLLGLVYALLALAILIALLGIVNTMMLSVFERTREIGLLRAVGMRRRQVRTMVRSESVVISLFGAIVGIVMGAGLGIALVASLRQQGVNDMAVPATDLVLFLVLSGVLGLVAATWPARRAARLDVLAAITTE